MPFLAGEKLPLSNKDILSWIFDDIQYDWDEPIYIDALDTSRSISARQARTLVRRLAAGLEAIGVQKGDCVSIHSFNDIYYPIFFLGVIAVGGVYAGTNPAYTIHELTHTTKIAHVKYVFTQVDLLPSILKAATANSIPKENIVIFNPHNETSPEGYLQWSDILSHGEASWERFNSHALASSTPAARLYSSGTTGLPKAAELSHLNFTAQNTLVFEADPRPYRKRRIVALPMFHAAMAPHGFCAPWKKGWVSYVLKSFDMEKWLWAFEKYEITDLGAVPAIVVGVINNPSLTKKYSLRSVRSCEVGAAPLDAGLQAKLKALFKGNVAVNQVWGMTETTCIATMHKWPTDDTTGSVGKPIANLDMKLVDDDGKDISGYDIRGEICVRGPTVFRGYYDNPEANAKDFDAQGYFHTGDIGFCDGKSKLWYIVDRKKELIKVRAFQVAPAEIEGVLLSHPEIVDAAVIGVPDPKREGDQSPRAYIIRRTKDGKPSEEDVKKWVQENLAYYKWLTGGVVFVDAISKNAAGKILKRPLREQAKVEMAGGRARL